MARTDTSAALRRYNAATAEYHEARETSDELAEAWDALPLRTRLRVMLAPAWGDALYEVRVQLLRWLRCRGARLAQYRALAGQRDDPHAAAATAAAFEALPLLTRIRLSMPREALYEVRDELRRQRGDR